MKRQKILALLFLSAVVGVVYFFETSDLNFSVKGVDDQLSDKLIMTFLDVGQGDSTLIRTPGGNDIIIDGGPDNTLVAKLGQHLPFNDRVIELIILTHPHSDHLVGLIEVMKRYEVKKILATGVIHTTADYLTWLDLIKHYNIDLEIIDSPRIVEVDQVRLEILSPTVSYLNQRVDNLNNTSIVLRLVYDEVSALFTGDLETEEELLAWEVTLASNIYKAGHHGANNGNSIEFVEAVSPDYAIVSAGKNNNFGHPHYRALLNLERSGAQILRTDEDGDIKLMSDGQDVYILD